MKFDNYKFHIEHINVSKTDSPNVISLYLNITSSKITSHSRIRKVIKVIVKLLRSTKFKKQIDIGYLKKIFINY